MKKILFTGSVLASALFVASLMGQPFGRDFGPPPDERGPSGPPNWIDVHGAGAQRSDPKQGDPGRFSKGRGPQGDSIMIYNFARCVRGESHGKPYTVVSTGQKRCYDDSGEIKCPVPGKPYFGQDGTVPSENFSYEITGGGAVVHDRVTGLMWQRSYSDVEWKDRERAAEEANRKRFGGYDDWRVPTIKELYSLIRFTGTTGSAPPGTSRPPSDAVPFLDDDVFKFAYGSPRYIDVQFITSSLYTGRVMGRESCFFGVNFADGRIKCYPTRGKGPEGSSYPIRLVRGNPSYGRNDFQEGKTGVIEDRSTGLVWMRYDSGHDSQREYMKRTRRRDGSLNWEEALAYCDALEFGGYSDWRLPDAKELQSIVDYSRSPDRTGSPALDSMFSTTEVKNPANHRDFPAFWTGTTHLDGPRHGSMGVYISFGRSMGNFDPRRPPRGMGPPPGSR